MIRLYVQDELRPGAALSLPPPSSHYLQTVMRLKSGAEILVFNGRDGEWRGHLTIDGKRPAVLTTIQQTRTQPEPPRLALLCALVKRPRLELIVEKAVELGVGRLHLLKTRRSTYDRPNLSRLRLIAQEAAEQTGRLELPELLGPAPLMAAIEAVGDEAPVVFCDEAGDDPAQEWGGASGRAPMALAALLTDAARPPRGRPAAVLVGPEGGFDPQEREWLRKRSNILAVSLGPRILRADTAAIAALVLVQSVLGDWADGEP